MAVFNLEDIKRELVNSLLENPEWLDTRTPKEHLMLDMDRMKRDLGYGYFVTLTCDSVLMLDTNEKNGGRRFSFPASLYYVSRVVFGNLVLKNHVTGDEHTVFNNGVLTLGSLKCSKGFSNASSGKYKAFYISYDYGMKHVKVKMHHMTRLMLDGSVALLSLGHDRLLDTHHVDPKQKGNNSGKNTKLVTRDEHYEAHRELRKIESV